MALNLGLQAPQSKFNNQSYTVNNFIDTYNPPDGDENKVLYRHQQDALIAMRNWYQDNNNHNTALVVLPTGSGKTGIAALTPYVLNATRVLIITPSAKLTEQIALNFGTGNGRSFYEERGLIFQQHLAHFVEPAYAIYKTTDMIRQMDRVNLVVANAHKFGPHANVDIEDISPNLFDLVIVDEAHHYPARTWKRIIDHFPNSKRVFLTATPYNRGSPILNPLENYLCFQLERGVMVDRGVIRPIEFQEVGAIADSEDKRFEQVGQEIIDLLAMHDEADPEIQHKAMVLTYLQEEADRFVDAINAIAEDTAAAYYSLTSREILDAFLAGEFKVLVVCGKLLEGFDHKPISVCAILRNVAPASKVLFTQFCGRCVRKAHSDDNVTAVVLSHVAHNQRGNFDSMDNLAEEDPEDD